MPSELLKKFRNPTLVRELGERLRASILDRPSTFMEVCGTHTMAIHRTGIPAMLPKGMRLLSGPGCPVCVTPTHYIDTAFAMARAHDVTLVTFGDMMRVPGTSGSLAILRSEGCDVKVVYSPLGALEYAVESGRDVVFLAVGFETTAPAVAATILSARKRGVTNFSILCAHKLVIPALAALVEDPRLAVDGFILPGHVSGIIGSEPYRFLAESAHRACVIAGFEPADILQSLCMLADQISADTPHIAIQYSGVVRPEGNVRAREMMDEVFTPATTEWRGFGHIPDSGLALRDNFREYDAEARFPVSVPSSTEPSPCRCGDILKGLMNPPDCPLFGGECTPTNPVGPCMVSSEGTCAAHYRYSRGSQVWDREGVGNA